MARALGITLLGGCALLAACTTILGNDFEIAPNAAGGGSSDGGAGGGQSGGGGTSSNGGAGGGGGAGGSAEVPDFTCDWIFDAHRELVTTEGSSDSLRDLVMVRRSSGTARIFVMRDTANSTNDVQVYTVGDDNTASYIEVRAATDVEQALRLSPTSTGIVYSVDQTFPNPHDSPRVIVVDDSDADASSLEIHTLVESGDLTDYAGGSVRVQGAAVSAGGIDDWKLDFMLSYEVTGGTYAEFYGRYDPDTGESDFYRRVTVPAGHPSANASDPLDILHVAGVTHAFHGEDGMRAYMLDGNTTLPTAGRTFGTLSQGLGPLRHDNGGYINVMAFDTAGGIEIFAGSIPEEDFGTFEPNDLFTAFTAAEASSLPVFEGEWRWAGNMFVMAGPDSDNAPTAGYFLIDNQGRQRGGGSLDFTGNIDPTFTRLGVNDMTTALHSDTFDDSGAILHAAWVDRQDDDQGTTHEVLYYDQIRCLPAQ